MVISSSNVGRGWGTVGSQSGASVEAINLALEWNARAHKLDWNIYDSLTPPPHELPDGFIWVFKNKWTVSEG